MKIIVQYFFCPRGTMKNLLRKQRCCIPPKIENLWHSDINYWVQVHLDWKQDNYNIILVVHYYCTFHITLLSRISQQPATPTRTIAATPIQSLPQSQTTPKRIDTPSLEEPSDLEELEQFAKTFKQRRIKLGFTQVGSHFHVEGIWSMAFRSEVPNHFSQLEVVSYF